MLSSEAMRQFKNVFSKHYKESDFKTSKQKDSQEFIDALLNRLTEDLYQYKENLSNRGTKPPTSIPNKDSLFYMEHVEKNGSIF